MSAKRIAARTATAGSMIIDDLARAFGSAIAEARHELLGGWFGRTFEPHPIHREPADLAAEHSVEADPLGRTRDLGIDR
jgi:hypothetical protein